MKTGVTVTGGLIIIVCVAALIYAVHNYRILYTAYLTLWMKYCGSFIRTPESLLMKNTGDDPDQPTEDIRYVDYIGDAELFY